MVSLGPSAQVCGTSLSSRGGVESLPTCVSGAQHGQTARDAIWQLLSEMFQKSKIGVGLSPPFA